MKRIDPLLRIAQAENDILKKYFEARRIRIYYRDDGRPESWTLEENKRGNRKPTILDGNAFRTFERIWVEYRRFEQSGFKDPVHFMYAIIGHWTQTDYSDISILEIVRKSFDYTVEFEEETGNFVYEYEEDENESDGEPNDK